MLTRSIVIVGGGTAGWLTAAYLARFFDLARNPGIEITLVSSDDVPSIGVGEGAFPTIRNTLQFIGIEESDFVRRVSATFKQGIRFDNWADDPQGGHPQHFFHPFEAPYQPDGFSLVAYWLLQERRTRKPFAEAMTIQSRVAEELKAPKNSAESGFAGPLNYAYHFDAMRLGEVLAVQAQKLGVRHLHGNVDSVNLNSETGFIDGIETNEHGTLQADFYIDCSGFHRRLIGRLDAPFHSVRDTLFSDRVLACKLPYKTTDAPLRSYTVASAHNGGWIWDIGLAQGRGIGCVYSSDHMSDDDAAATMNRYLGSSGDEANLREIRFDAGYLTTPWVRNCVAVGLSGGFLEPLESTGLVMIETAAAMIAEMLPLNGTVSTPARRFNELMRARYKNTVSFLKLHYCISRRSQSFWKDNREPSSVPSALNDLLTEWKYRPPGRFDFILDLENFAFFNYQYILYGMGFDTDLSGSRTEFPNSDEAERVFERIRNFGAQAAEELPAHRTLVDEINAGGAFPA